MASPKPRVGIPTLFGLFLFVVTLLPARDRVIILADMGNEPDEEQQMVHLLMSCNAFDLEGLIAVTGKYLREDPRPELFHHLIDGYSRVVGNLELHAAGWPSPEHLHAITAAGQPGYGIGDTGPGRASAGSALIAKALLKEDPRPLYVVVNAGSNTLAQALIDLQAGQSPDQMARVVERLRVFENGSQDNAGAWICHEFPEIHWVRSNYQTYSYGGPGNDGGPDGKQLGPHTWEPYAYSTVGQHQWLLENVIAGHGPLGKLYPLRLFRMGGLGFQEGGGTIPWIGLLHPGLSDINHPSWGGWSGRYSREKSANPWSRHPDIRPDEETYGGFAAFIDDADTWTDPKTGIGMTNSYAPVWRFRQAMFNDQLCRMDWCGKPFEQANHHPVAVFNGDATPTIVRMRATAGDVLGLDAGGSSDPDGDPLAVSWWIYPEAGTYPGAIAVPEPSSARTCLVIPGDAAGTQIHLVLEVADLNKIASLCAYRRIVIDVL
ncbi:MAG: DUF1593 domain-containing protein [Opitutaceae bacterium]